MKILQSFLSYSFLLFFLIFINNPVLSQGLPPDFSDEEVVAVNKAVGITFDENGQGYIWEKGGVIHVLDTNNVLLSTPLMNIWEEVGNWGDHGMLGMTLHPDFLENGYFYLLYVVDRNYLLNFGTPDYDPQMNITNEATIGRITRFTADIQTNFTSVVPNSRKVLLGQTVEGTYPVLFNSHGVGSLTFGNDGTLLASFGDAGSWKTHDLGSAEETYYLTALAEGIIREKENIGSFKSIYLDNIAGKVIRINPETGEGFPSNPFYDPAAPNAPRSKVWASGFRNPYRMIYKSGTGSHFPEEGNPGILILGDVGAGAWEELNIIKEGGKWHGWPFFEGLDPQSKYSNHPRKNYDAPNPLFDGNNCTQEFFNFQDLTKEDTITGIATFSNPCNHAVEIPAEIPTFLHARPAVVWSNSLWNTPAKTRLPAFTSENVAAWRSVDSPNSEVESPIFGGFSSIPGAVYENGPFPEAYHGAIFCTDYSGWIKAMYLDEEHNLTKIENFYDRDTGIVHLTFNQKDGCIYYVHHLKNRIHKICYGGNPAPVAVAETNLDFGPSPLTVELDASNSYHPFGNPITYHWDFGDGQSSDLASPEHTFVADSNAPQSFDVTLTVTDSVGTSKQTRLIISTNNTPPEVTITSFEDGDFYPPSGVTWLPLRANVTDAEHPESELNYEWITIFQHNTHSHVEPSFFGTEGNAIIPPTGCEELYSFTIILEVTDAHGLVGRDSKEIFPFCDDPFFEIIDLTATANKNSVWVNWTSSFEEDMVAYEIQRSADYRFVGIGETLAEGTSNAANAYNFEDKNPSFGLNYYRIKGIRADGAYLYSNQVSVFFPGEGNVFLYPNPASGQITIDVKEAKKEEIEMEVYNAIGILKLETSWLSEVGNRSVQNILTSDFENGVYYFIIKNGDDEENGSFVITK